MLWYDRFLEAEDEALVDQLAGPVFLFSNFGDFTSSRSKKVDTIKWRFLRDFWFAYSCEIAKDLSSATAKVYVLESSISNAFGLFCMNCACCFYRPMKMKLKMIKLMSRKRDLRGMLHEKMVKFMRCEGLEETI